MGAAVDIIDLISGLETHTLWLLSGLVFLGLGMLVGEPSLAGLGIAAIITAIAALTVTSFTVQLLLWGVLAVALAVVMQGMVPREAKDLTPSKEAEVSEPIPSGGVGMVAYQGSLWNARCQISDVAIAAGETVNVMGRHGNTLIVLPVTFPDNHIYDQTG
jgi:membrane protein implicated in regulation of membrane protease activity